jgi:hypothetical protein
MKGIEIIDKQDRNILFEGRSNHMGFAFAKKKSESEYELVQPISPCKDYLSDVVYSEHTGKECKACGLVANKKDIFDEISYAYMVISIVGYKGKNKWNDEFLPKEIEKLKNNYKNLEAYINLIEEKLKIKYKTEITEVKDNLYLIKVPKFWVKYTYLISLYSLLLRSCQFHKGKDEKYQDPIEYLEHFDAFMPDVNLVKGALPKLKRILEGELPEQDLNDKMYNNGAIHSYGIVAFKFPSTEVVTSGRASGSFQLD